ncbi:MAG: UDP-3-O-(3-hydroxymyristoyl)glucosamine N-acyltransferase [Candidatus Pacebacteria bacterium]|nr:UDP-3-O-(3-hydroxymyristoyl)glucosamine N-acyltransferase [Candidatus Paceibacterota bacterium]
MPDQRFYTPAAELKLEAIIAEFKLNHRGAESRPIIVKQLDSLAAADQWAMALLLDRYHLDEALRSRAAVILTTYKLSELLTDWSGRIVIHPEPKIIWAQLAHRLYPETETHPADGPAIHPTATLGKDCQIGKNTVIGAGVMIGDGARIGANCSISHSIIGKNFTLYPNSMIGRPGFGFVASARGLLRMPQLGRVIIGNGVEIGATTTVDRGSLEDTVIGDGCKIDNGVQIAHNCRIGNHCILTGHVGLAGTVTLGNGVVIGGAAIISDHITVGDGVQIAMGSVITRDIAAGSKMAGYPALPVQQWLRRAVRDAKSGRE